MTRSKCNCSAWTAPHMNPYLSSLTIEALALAGSKERYEGEGTVEKIDGTTTFITSGDSQFLACSRKDMTVGARVLFTKDQLRAKNVEVLKAEA
jgi:hypothetical protein